MDKEPDLIAIKFVALDGHRMAIKQTHDRIAAIKIMTTNNVLRQEMAWRLCMSVQALETFARRYSIELPPTIPKAHWSLEYIDKSNTPSSRDIRNKRAKEKYKKAKKDIQ